MRRTLLARTRLFPVLDAAPVVSAPPYERRRRRAGGLSGDGVGAARRGPVPVPQSCALHLSRRGQALAGAGRGQCRTLTIFGGAVLNLTIFGGACGWPLRLGPRADDLYGQIMVVKSWW